METVKKKTIVWFREYIHINLYGGLLEAEIQQPPLL